MHKPNAPSKLFINTNMPYALCSDISCNIDIKNPKNAICHCPVYGVGKQELAWQKASVGAYNYQESTLKINQNKQVGIIRSNFSLANRSSEASFKNVTCQFNKPAAWANCFGSRCSVNYQQKNGIVSKTARCVCPILRTNSFVSLGPKSKSECQLPKNKLWSAATKTQAKNYINVIKITYNHFYPNSPYSTNTKDIH